MRNPQGYILNNFTRSEDFFQKSANTFLNVFPEIYLKKTLCNQSVDISGNFTRNSFRNSSRYFQRDF